MEWNESEFQGIKYHDPRDELRARLIRATEVGDSFVAVPVELVKKCLSLKECTATTVVNGDPMTKTLIQVRCRKLVNPMTMKHIGNHQSGDTIWTGPYS